VHCAFHAHFSHRTFRPHTQFECDARWVVWLSLHSQSVCFHTNIEAVYAPVAVPAWGGPSGPPGPHPHPTSTTHEYEHGIRPWDGPRRLLSNGRISALFSAVGDSAGRRTGASPGTGASEAQTCDTRSGSLCAGASPGPLPNAVEERETPSNGGRADCATWQRRPRDARAGLLSFSWR